MHSPCLCATMRSKFAKEVIAPRALEYDRSMKYPQDIFEQAWELGLVNSHIPEVCVHEHVCVHMRACVRSCVGVFGGGRSTAAWA